MIDQLKNPAEREMIVIAGAAVALHALLVRNTHCTTPVQLAFTIAEEFVAELEKRAKARKR